MQASEAAAEMAAFVGELVRQMVKQPDEVKVTGKLDGGKLRLIVDVAPADRGHVIGKEGRAARSLATILKAVGTRKGLECDLDIPGNERVTKW